MSRAYKCDRCGEYGLGEGKDARYSKRSNFKDGPMVDMVVYFNHQTATIDLCPSCHGEIDVAIEKMLLTLFPEAKS